MAVSTDTLSAGAFAASRTEAASKSRIASIDVMRGLVILFMMLDHVRERIFLHVPLSDPMDVDATAPALYFTRYLAHLCAPLFIFLTGLSAWLYAHPAGGAYRSPTAFLFKRGLFLVFIEVTVIYLVWASSFTTVYLQVIWAIGVCMIALSVLARLNYWLIGALGFLIVFGHNLLSPIGFTPNELGYTLWTILHDRNFLVDDGLLKIKVSYPVLPWIGVILLGYFAGPLYARSTDMPTRRKFLIALGLAGLALLLVLRGFNLYGETLPWSAQDTAIKTVMSFLNYTKYPPSLDFLLVTLGIGFLLLAWFESMQNKVLAVIEVYGSVPMFVYILHLYVLLAAYGILRAVFGANQGDRFGVDHVGWIWIGAAVLAVALYRPTKAFADYKHREKRNKPWLSYF
ncbi:MAG: DUF1624 domain-containing protein [Gammaproteobacteria bacterium]